MICLWICDTFSFLLTSQISISCFSPGAPADHRAGDNGMSLQSGDADILRNKGSFDISVHRNILEQAPPYLNQVL